MRQLKITAFWDLFIGTIVSSILILISIYIYIVVVGNKGWNNVSWYYALICAFCISISVTIMLSLQRIMIDLSCDKVKLFYLVDFNRK